MTDARDEDHAVAALLAAGWLTAAQALADLAALTPDPREALAYLRAGAEVLEPVAAALDLAGAPGEEHLAPLREATDSLTRHTRPATRAQAALKLHLLLGAGQDLVARAGSGWSEPVRSLLAAGPGADALRGGPDGLQRALDEDLDSPADEPDERRSRLALHGRRLVGEATAQAQRVLSRDAALAETLVGEQRGSLEELEGTTQLLADLVEGAATRMLALGLQP